MVHTDPRPSSSLADALEHLNIPSLAQAAVARGTLPDYAEPLPHLEKGALRATFESVFAGGAPSHVLVQMVGGFPRTGCTCGHWSFSDCPASLALLLDLSLCAPFRAAALEGRVTRATLDDARAARDARLSQEVVRNTLSLWFPTGPGSARGAPAALQWALEFDADGRYETALGLRARLHGERTQLQKRALEELRLEGTDARLAALCADADTSGKKFLLRGAAATFAVELLQRCEGRVVSSDFKTPVRFRAEPLSLRFDLLEVTDAELHSWPQGRYGGARGGRRGEARTVSVLAAQWHLGEGQAPLPVARSSVLPGTPSWVWLPHLHTLRPAEAALDRDFLLKLVAQPFVPDSPTLRFQLYPALREQTRGLPIALPPAEAMGHPALQKPFLALRIDGSALDVRATLTAQYPAQTLELDPASVAAAGSDVHRDVGTEDSALARLEAAGLRWSADAKAFTAEDEAAVHLWREGLAALRANVDPRFELLVAENLQRTKLREQAHPRLRIRLVENWFDVELSVSEGDARADVARMREALRNKRRWVALDDGTLAQVDGTLRELLEEWDELGAKDERARLPVHQAGRVDRWLDAEGAAVLVDEAAERFRAKLRAATVRPEPVLPEGLEATLRPYQLAGLAWLQFLHELGAGGVLADDMGLGKTVTTLAWLAWMKQTEGPAPSLVVCPTSVLGTWRSEAARFTPGLRVAVLHGSTRGERLERAGDFDLLVTSYALVRRDAEKLRSVGLRALVLDEAQNIKNASAQTTRAVRAVPAKHRLALTGTPVENRLNELWSLMDFCNAGMLGTPRAFEQKVEKRVLEDSRGGAAKRLRAVLRPFVLRRTKAEVLTELPPKQEIDRTFALSPKQRKAYDTLALALRTDVAKAVAERGMAGAGLSVFTALLRLRQMACDPRLVDPTFAPDTSAKRVAFLELVRQLVAEGRRALVFSQFVELLTLWRRDLDAEKIRYEYLDGSTRDREAVVERFQHGDAPLFLLSLKAGGTGLNLTAADTVIHCDPWWNPAVEAQATDRAHRIGQLRSVTVYRLLAAGTVEDKIQQLKSKKKELADAVVQEDAGALRGLSEQDLTALLAASEADWEGDDNEDDEEVR